MGTELNWYLLFIVCFAGVVKCLEWAIKLKKKRLWYNYKLNLKRIAIHKYVGISYDNQRNLPHSEGCNQGEWWSWGCSCGVEEMNGD